MRYSISVCGLAGWLILVFGGCGKPSGQPMGTPSGVVGPSQVDSQSDEEREIVATLAKMLDDERKAAEAQRVCPVTGERLGSMGVPPKVDVSGRGVYLCCGGCKSALEKDPDKYLAKLDAPKTTAPSH